MREFAVLWIALGVGLITWALVLSGCGDTTNLYSAAVAPVAPTQVSFQTPCAPPVTAAPGHVVTGSTYRVWSGDCSQVEHTTVYTDTAPPSEQWPEPIAPCVRVPDVTPISCN